MSDVMDYVLAHLDDVKVISQSTNVTGALATPWSDVIVKRQALEDDKLSPFWARIKALFDSTFTLQRAAMPKICALYAENPHIPPADFIGTDEKRRVTVFAKMAGEGWEPDEFPEDSAVARQLGAFIGFMHKKAYPACGLPGNLTVDNFVDRLRKYVLEKKAERGGAPEAVERFLRNGLETTGYSLIMTDISANQFLFAPGKITACVDFDACVIGPREWELELIELTVSDMAAFRAGYEEYLPYPDMKNTRGLYDFVMN